MNIANWLNEAGQRWPNRPALYQGLSLVANYSEFVTRTRQRACSLAQQHGIVPGERVALFMKNSCDYLELLYAIWWVGAVAVPINARLHPTEAAWIATDAQARLIFSDSGQCFGIGQLPSDCQESDEAQAIATEATDAPPCPRLAGDLAWLFYTSGTTGRSKGVMLSHANLIAMSLCYPVDVDPVEAQDAVVYAAPMSHGAGLYNFIHVRCGARHVIPQSRGFQAAELIELARGLDNVTLFAAPTMIKLMVDEARRQSYDGSGIKTLVYGGAPMYVADLRAALDTFGPRLVQIYGQGESPMTISALSRDIIADRSHVDWALRAASVGRAQSCVEIRILDNEHRPLATGQPGQIAVRGATVMQGYWRNTLATQQTLMEGWLLTGDIGFLDTAGYLTLTDRCKDVIISGGSNVYPREVEEVLAQHPQVAEVSVIGEPDPKWGESVVAFIVPRQAGRLDESLLTSWFVERMASFKKPRKYVFLEELPKNGYGKILKTQLRHRLQSAAD